MNKRVNLYLNILEFFFFALAMLFMYNYFKYTTTSFLVRNSFFLFGSVMGLIFIGIELFLFILMKTKSKILYLTILLIDAVLAVLLNVKVPFIFIIIFLSFSLIKNIGRIIFVNELYIPREYNYYARMFGLKIKDFKKKKVKKITKKKEYIEIPAEKKVEKQKREKKATKALKETV